jgi:hypothetical protein
MSDGRPQRRIVRRDTSSARAPQEESQQPEEQVPAPPAPPVEETPTPTPAPPPAPADEPEEETPFDDALVGSAYEAPIEDTPADEAPRSSLPPVNVFDLMSDDNSSSSQSQDSFDDPFTVDEIESPQEKTNETSVDDDGFTLPPLGSTAPSQPEPQEETLEVEETPEPPQPTQTAPPAPKTEEPVFDDYKPSWLTEETPQPEAPEEPEETQETPEEPQEKKSRFSSSKKEKKAKEKGEKTKRTYSPKAKSLMITGGTLFAIVAILGFSISQVAQAPSEDDLVTVYQTQSGDYGFPIDRGVNTATEFLTAYLTIPNEIDLRNQRRDLLKEFGPLIDVPTSPSELSQRVVSGPSPAGLMIQDGPLSANQRFSAIVEQKISPEVRPDGEQVGEEIVTWEKVTYRVNMQVDPATARVAITGNPTLLPNEEIQTPQNVSGEQLDGGLSAEIQSSLVDPFMEAWAASDEPVINKFLASGVDASWAKGFDGKLSFDRSKTSVPASVGANQGGDINTEVTWISRDGTTQTSSYTLSVVFENGGWLLKNLY